MCVGGGGGGGRVQLKFERGGTLCYTWFDYNVV